MKRARNIRWSKQNDIPETTWNLAIERTRGLAIERLRWDPSINNLVANAYLQGVTDVGANLELIKKIIEQAHNEENVRDGYCGA